MRTYDDTLKGMVGSFAIYIVLSGGWWAFDTRADYKSASARAKVLSSKGRKVQVKRISSLEAAESVDHQIQKYDDWATD